MEGREGGRGGREGGREGRLEAPTCIGSAPGFSQARGLGHKPAAGLLQNVESKAEGRRGDAGGGAAGAGLICVGCAD